MDLHFPYSSKFPLPPCILGGPPFPPPNMGPTNFLFPLSSLPCLSPTPVSTPCLSPTAGAVDLNPVTVSSPAPSPRPWSPRTATRTALLALVAVAWLGALTGAWKAAMARWRWPLRIPPFRWRGRAQLHDGAKVGPVHKEGGSRRWWLRLNSKAGRSWGPNLSGTTIRVP
jgi:hypothetical protein